MSTSTTPALPHDPKPHIPYLTSYDSLPVSLPADLLTSAPPKPVTASPIDWRSTPLPEWQGRHATVLDNVLTPQDDRIVWDEDEVVRRLWARLRLARHADGAPFFADDGPLAWAAGDAVDGGWRFWGLNRRMRFLRYGPGQFFRRQSYLFFFFFFFFSCGQAKRKKRTDSTTAHCDGTYEEVSEGRHRRTYYTVHFYLNDSVQAVGDDAGADLRGGATCFLSYDEKRRLNVDPKAGRALIFQHPRMYHAGDDVLAGTKYTMRTEMMYELVDGVSKDRHDAELA
ncbi:Cytoplasmic dynein 1 intermediate chain 1 [Verticillium dahliae VDG1]|nr:Cytoplasmic dynein 1 intermediate chain 1 [Verticillium dahliae VDG1]